MDRRRDKGAGGAGRDAETGAGLCATVTDMGDEVAVKTEPYYRMDGAVPGNIAGFSVFPGTGLVESAPFVTTP